MKTVLRLLSAILLLMAAASPAATYGFTPDTYASTSVLAGGRWVKISVSETGMYLISNADLRAWGFRDPSAVRVYGYGGRRIPDHFTRASYTDDLPLVQSAVTPRGVVFYGVGTDTRLDVPDTGYHYRSRNPYSLCGYYFLSDSGAPLREIPSEGREPGLNKATTFVEGLFHETDLTSPMQSGHLLLGEDFRYNKSQTFSFNMPGRVEGSEVWMQTDFYASAATATVLGFTANGEELPLSGRDRCEGVKEGGDTCRVRKTFVPKGERLVLGIDARVPGGATVAALDNISIAYVRALRMPASEPLSFTIPKGLSPVLSGADDKTAIWDVTDPLDIVAVSAVRTSDGLSWSSEVYGRRSYVAWREAGSFLTPRLTSMSVAAQDLHGEENPDMVIISHPDLMAQARRIAELHSSGADSLKVLLTEPGPVYNEFASGVPDYNAFRRLLKMFYDRAAADPSKRSPRYLLLMGGVSPDHRRITSAWKNSPATLLPIWQTDQGYSDSYSYSSDDPAAFLDDNSGLINGRDIMRVAVGRIPARSLEEAKVFTDRLIKYVKSPAEGEWRNRVALLADDGDNAIHLNQTEDTEAAMRSNIWGNQLTYNKIYLDTYTLTGGVSKAGRTKLHTLLDEGVLWWGFIGHASPTALTSEGVFVYQDHFNLYMQRPAFFYGATCSFSKWDDVDEAGLQLLTLTEAGGLVGGIAAVRPVLIARNGPLSEAFGARIFDRDASGRHRPVAEVLRLTKNAMLGETNKMRYVMLGDPAMRLAMPDNLVKLDSINDKRVADIGSEEEPAVMEGFSKVRLKGRVTGPLGQTLTGFDGSVSVTLYDAEKSYTTVRGDYDEPPVIDEQGDRLLMARIPVKGGIWEGDIFIPGETADNYRPATMSLYARSTGGETEASGVSRDFYIYGMAEQPVEDNTPPVIEYAYLNHESFRSGDIVNDTPMLLARVSDDVALNMASNSIGHQMSLRIDGQTNYTDVVNAFTPDQDGSPAGTIAYQVPELQEGQHTATLKVWDISGHSATHSFDFFVDKNSAPKIFDIYTDANPAVSEANFYIRHNRPDAMLRVTVEVFDLNGRRIWQSEQTAKADMFASSPLTWDLTDRSGRRVARGIYLYKATVNTYSTQTRQESSSSSGVRRLAVAAM